jgi:hypothetical protein
MRPIGPSRRFARGPPATTIGACWGEHALVRGQRARARDVEQEVEALTEFHKVLLRVVHDAVGSERVRQLDVRSAAHSRHLGSERLRDLDRERAHATGRAVDQHLLPALEAALVAQALERGRRRDCDGRGLLDRHGGRALHDRTIGACHDVLRKRAGPCP